MHVEHLTWREYQELLASRIVVLPMGSIDGHGPHLPMSTDTIISTYLAEQLTLAVDAVVLPALPYGVKTDPPASGGVFPAVDLQGATLTNVMLELLRASYRGGARRFVVIEAHKVNLGPVREAASRFIGGAPDARIMVVAWWDVVSEDSRNAVAAETDVGRHDDHHAAMVETSLIMHIAPGLVRTELLGDDLPARRARYLILPVPDDLKTEGGVVHRAAKASAAIGERLLSEIVTTLVDAVRLELG